MLMYVDESRKNEWIPQRTNADCAIILGKSHFTPFRCRMLSERLPERLTGNLKVSIYEIKCLTIPNFTGVL